jgi:maltoporin
MKNKYLLAALPLALACGSLAAQDVFELHGYVRAGAGRDSNGGEQQSFFLPGACSAPTGGPGYRLGNETDNYIELAMDVRAYDKGNESFKLHFRPAFREYYSARDSSADAGGNIDTSYAAGNNQMVFLREAWGEAAGMLGNSYVLKDANLWAGNRFYQRHDLHVIDLYYWNVAGNGFGIENLNVGFAKFHYAYIQQDSNNLTDTPGYTGGPNTGMVNSSNNPTGGGCVTAIQDLRLTDMSIWKGSTFSLGFDYYEPSVRKTTLVPPTKAPTVANPFPAAPAGSNFYYNNGGRQFRLEYVQGGILGGDNKIYLTQGDGATFWNWYNPGVSTKNNWSEIFDNFFIQPTQSFGMNVLAIHRVQHEVDPQKTGDGWRDMAWTSFGIRPQYSFTKHISITGEIGSDKFKVTGDDRTRSLTKKTLALQVAPQPAWWSRPVIRLFVTKANWNKEAENWGTAGGMGAFGPNALTGTSFGVQLEGWW